MKLFDREIGSEFLSNGPWYSLLALYMPMSMLAALLLLLENLFSLSLPIILLITFS